MINYDTELFYTFEDGATGFLRIGKCLAAEYDTFYIIKGGRTITKNRIQKSGFYNEEFYNEEQFDDLVAYVDLHNAGRLNQIYDAWHKFQNELGVAYNKQVL